MNIDQQDSARAALIAVALRFCGHRGDLRPGDDRALTLVLGTLQKLGIVEGFEHYEQTSGANQVDYVGLCFTASVKDEVERVATILALPHRERYWWSTPPSWGNAEFNDV